ncbi:MAG: lipocalin family protein [Elusimicrobia bacterium]|nr:lipocalin family protein [Candidatus Liberimonas magnetica]
MTFIGDFRDIVRKYGIENPGTVLMKAYILIVALFAFPSIVTGAQKLPDIKTVDYVDINRYMGTWYEVARITHWFEKGLVSCTANYKLLDNGKVQVLNTGHRRTPDGKIKLARGKAYVADKQTNAKLKVTFFWPFYGDYWIIELGKDYEYAVVGGPGRKYFWVLSRTPDMSPEVYNAIIEKAKAQGYDLSKIEKMH